MKGMKWSSKSSMVLSRVMVLLFVVALVLLDVFAIRITGVLGRWFLGYSGGLKEGLIFVGTLYGCSIPGYILLYSLYRLIRNLEQGQVFVPQNVAYLRRVSWCCVAAAIICFAGVGTYHSFLIITVAASFMALIVRVIKNIFQQAILMKDELDLTV